MLGVSEAWLPGIGNQNEPIALGHKRYTRHILKNTATLVRLKLLEVGDGEQKSLHKSLFYSHLPETGLEPVILSEPDPKSGASAIPPRARSG